MQVRRAVPHRERPDQERPVAGLHPGQRRARPRLAHQPARRPLFHQLRPRGHRGDHHVHAVSPGRVRARVVHDDGGAVPWGRGLRVRRVWPALHHGLLPHWVRAAQPVQHAGAQAQAHRGVKP